jgi:hypothetical protein
MRDRFEGDDKQSTHARVLEALEATIAAHPAGSNRRRKPQNRIYANDDVVVPFRPKVVQLVPRNAGGDDPDAPSAA